MELKVTALTRDMGTQIANLLKDHRATRSCMSLETTKTFLEGRGGTERHDLSWKLPLYHLADSGAIVGRNTRHYMEVVAEPLPKVERIETKCRWRLIVNVILNTGNTGSTYPVNNHLTDTLSKEVT